MLKIAICDDEEKYREEMQTSLSEYQATWEGDEIRAFFFSSGRELLSEIDEIGAFDLYILDIVMPNMGGIELGLGIRERDEQGKIVYLTSTEEFAVRSYRVRAFDYLLKSCEKHMLFDVLNRVLEEISICKKQFVMVKTSDETLKISHDEILYAELSHRSLIWYLTDGRILKSVTVRIPFAEAIGSLLGDERFFMCGASLVINLFHVTSVEKDAVVFQKSKRLYTPKSACSSIRSGWLDYWLKNGRGGKL